MSPILCQQFYSALYYYLVWGINLFRQTLPEHEQMTLLNYYVASGSQTPVPW